MQEVEDTQERVSVGRAVSRDKEIVTIEKARTVKRTIERTRRGSRRQTDVQAVADEVAQAATLPRTESLPIGSQELIEEPEEEKKEDESPSKRVTRSSKKIAVRQEEDQEAKVQEQEEEHEEEAPMEQEEVPMEQEETGGQQQQQQPPEQQQQQQGEEEEEETQMEEETGAGAGATEEEEQPEQPPQPSPRKATMSKKDVPPRTPRGKKAPAKATAAKKTKAKDTKAKRARNKRKRTIDDMDPFDTYIHKVLKQVHPECRLSKKSVELINDFIADIYEKVTHECKILCERTGRKTLSSREVQTAVRLTLPGELAKHAVSEGTKAVSYAMS